MTNPKTLCPAGERGSIKWNENWTTFLESLLQLHLLRLPKQQHYAINHIEKIVIDPRKHMDLISNIHTDSGESFLQHLWEPADG